VTHFNTGSQGRCQEENNTSYDKANKKYSCPQNAFFHPTLPPFRKIECIDLLDPFNIIAPSDTIVNN
jgi:hypothetical protein